MADQINCTTLRGRIASGAARMIAEDGLDYYTAKRKSAQQVLGSNSRRADLLPDNTQIEAEVRRYNSLFLAEQQPARLLLLRQLAVQLMTELASFRPYLTGAVQNGTAGRYSEIHLQLFPDNPKDIVVFLLNQQIAFETSEMPHFARPQEAVETLSFLWHGESVHLAIYDRDDLRSGDSAAGSRNKARKQRSDLASVRALLDETHNETSS